MTKRKRKFNWKIFCIIAGCILLVYFVFAILPRTQCIEDNPFLIEKGARPLLIAHGGGHKEFPDNTLEACYNAYSVDENVMLEMDVSITKDDVVIMSHDTTLDRRTDANGAIADWNYSDLIEQKVNFGYLNEDKDGNLLDEKIKFKDFYGKQVTPRDVPNYPDGLPNRDPDIYLATTLKEVLEAFPDNTVNVEIKQKDDTGLRALAAVVEILEEEQAFDRVVLASFHNKIYKEIKNIAKEKAKEGITLLCSPEYVGVGTLLISGALKLDALYAEPVAVLQVPMNLSIIRMDKKWFVDAAHSHNVAVHFWTIDKEKDMRYLIEIGADGIMTNLPHLLKKVYDDVFGK
ncbi:MAG: hypothetical protein NC132_04100 [Corallococcus sp.]|nr:hypothetical protein [Corallococcus sp.]MCM1359841.1 hypothetical protein [Corallococcus sp.]MCM1395275.1 hypothetical protein [Corallococcus sp.]